MISVIRQQKSHGRTGKIGILQNRYQKTFAMLRNVKTKDIFNVLLLTRRENNIKNYYSQLSTSPEQKSPTKKNVFLMGVFDYLEKVSHMDEVRKSQNRVMHIKNELHCTSNEKRRIMRKLEAVRQSQHHIYSEMKIQGNRGSQRYMDLIRDELELCNSENKLQEQYAAADAREYLLFNEFSAAITNSYEKEKMHSNFIKVLGILGAIFGSLLTLIASIGGHIYQQNKLLDLRSDMQRSISNEFIRELESTKKLISNLKTQTSMGATEAKVSESWGSYLNRHSRWMYSWMLPKSK